jgi:hypothetical protein
MIGGYSPEVDLWLLLIAWLLMAYLKLIAGCLLRLAL